MIFPSTPEPETSNIGNASFDLTRPHQVSYTSNLSDFCLCPCSIRSFLFSGQAQPLCQAVECCSRGRSWIGGWKCGWHRRMLYEDFKVNYKLKCGRDFWQFQFEFDAAQPLSYFSPQAGSWSAKQRLKPAELSNPHTHTLNKTAHTPIICDSESSV